MANRTTGQAIKEKLRVGGGQNRGDPVSPSSQTTNSQQEVQEKDPPDRIKGFRKINLQHDSWIPLGS